MHFKKNSKSKRNRKQRARGSGGSVLSEYKKKMRLLGKGLNHRSGSGIHEMFKGLGNLLKFPLNLVKGIFKGGFKPSQPQQQETPFQSTSMQDETV